MHGRVLTFDGSDDVALTKCFSSYLFFDAGFYLGPQAYHSSDQLTPERTSCIQQLNAQSVRRIRMLMNSIWISFTLWSMIKQSYTPENASDNTAIY
jgi:hypothetical protein